jgi:hypothetical protein
MLARKKPLRRTAWKRAPQVSVRAAKQIEYVPRARDIVQVQPSTALVLVHPKTEYVRDERLRDMCRSMACQSCGSRAGSTWAHSNWGDHHKGAHIKASDVFVAALCGWCHRDLDQGSRLTYDERRRMWDLAHWRTLIMAVTMGAWPPGIPMPALPAEAHGLTPFE